jgi:hypothetical protein
LRLCVEWVLDAPVSGSESSRYLSVLDDQLDWLQRIADTRTGDAFAGIDLEQCVVRRTLNEHIVHVEELVFLPFKIGPGVRTAVDIAVEIAILKHDEQSDIFSPVLNFERL